MRSEGARSGNRRLCRGGRWGEIIGEVSREIPGPSTCPRNRDRYRCSACTGVGDRHGMESPDRHAPEPASNPADTPSYVARQRHVCRVGCGINQQRRLGLVARPMPRVPLLDSRPGSDTSGTNRHTAGLCPRELSRHAILPSHQRLHSACR